MKWHMRVLGAFGVIMLLSALCGSPAGAVTAASGDSDRPARLITVTGEAAVQVVPDEVVLTLGVETVDKDLGAAKRQNDEIVKQALAVVERYDIASKDIKTDFINIEPRYQDSYQKRDFVGYFVRKTIEITLRDISRFEALLTDLLDAGVNYVHGIQFRTTQLRKYRDQARALAIKAAREKAEAMAGELDQEIGEPTSIQEEPTWWWSSYGSWWGQSWGGMTQNVVQNAGNAPAETEGTLAPGQISVTARVTVSFALE